MSDSTESKDISMVDVSTAPYTAINTGERETERNEPLERRKSTLILTDEAENEKMPVDGKSNEEPKHGGESIGDGMHVDSAKEQTEDSGDNANRETTEGHGSVAGTVPPEGAPKELDPNIAVPVEIKWVLGGEKVYVTGSFTGWRKMIGLEKAADSTFSITLGLPVGTHRFRFVVDNELRFSDYLPTATDQMGNFVNYIEVTPDRIQSHLEEEQSKKLKEEEESRTRNKSDRRLSAAASRSESMAGLINDDDDMGGGYSRYHDEDSEGDLNYKPPQYISDIPPIFTDPKVMEQYYVAIEKQAKNQNQQQAWLHPPQLPPHLENVILNNFNSMDKDNNSGALPIPNHVVLNHLATTNIKHNTLAVASMVRYKRKYVTQVLYAPLQQ